MPITSTCWENAKTPKSWRISYRIETDRVAAYLEKTRSVYHYRIGYCLGLFREALIRGSQRAGVPIDLLLPTRDLIDKIIEEGDCIFEEGSLSMEEYLGEFCDELIRFRNSLAEESGK